MALKFKTSGASDDALAQLLQLAQYSQQRQDRKSNIQNSMYKEFSNDLTNAYDNSNLDNKKMQLNQYYQENKDNMSEDMISKFDMLSQRYDMQRESNISYNNGIEEAKVYSQDIEKMLTDYSEIGEKEVFYEKNDEGEDIAVMFESQEELENYRSNLRKKKSEELATKISDYNEFNSNFRGAHGERLSSAFGRKDDLFLSSLNEMFVFGVGQVEDDYLFDEEEAKAYKLGIISGSTVPIESYMNNEQARTNRLNTSQEKQMNELYQETEIMKGIVDNFEEWESMILEDGSASPEKIAKMKETLFIDEDGNQITYEEAADSTSEGGMLLQQYTSQSIENVDKLKNIDNKYTRRVGTSLLDPENPNTINTSGNEKYKSEIAGLDDFTPTGGGIDGGTGADTGVGDKGKEDKVVDKPKGTAIISEDDSEWFSSKGYYPAGGRSGKGWTADTTIKEEKVNDFMSMAFNPDNFQDGKIKEDSEIYKIIQRAKKGGSRRMKKVEEMLKRYAQGIKNLKALEKEGFDPPAWANKLVDEVEWLLTTTKRRK